jgi:hypothetical protein
MCCRRNILKEEIEIYQLKIISYVINLAIVHVSLMICILSKR